MTKDGPKWNHIIFFISFVAKSARSEFWLFFFVNDVIYQLVLTGIDSMAGNTYVFDSRPCCWSIIHLWSILLRSVIKTLNQLASKQFFHINKINLWLALRKLSIFCLDGDIFALVCKKNFYFLKFSIVLLTVACCLVGKSFFL